MSSTTTEPRIALPTFVRFKDLKAAGIVMSWPALARMIRHEGFPPGIRLARNTRAWALTDIESWLASRPVEPALNKKRAARSEAEEQTAQP